MSSKLYDIHKQLEEKAKWINKAKKSIVNGLCPNIQVMHSLIYEKEIEMYNLNDKIKQQRNKGENK